MSQRATKKDPKPTTAGQQQGPQATEEAKAIPILECPQELGPAARQEWERIVSELIAKAVLSRFDRGPLAAYCTAYALAMEAAEMVHKHGAMIKSPNGFPMQSPYLSHLNQQVATMMRIATEFGFTPASRSRIFDWEHRKSLLLDGTAKPSGGLEW